mgnify:CR=1 FL=1
MILVLPGFARRCPPARWRKATRPLTSTLFDPAIFPRIPGKWPYFKSGQQADSPAFWYIFASCFQIGNTGGHGASQGQEDDGSGPMETG